MLWCKTIILAIRVVQRVHMPCSFPEMKSSIFFYYFYTLELETVLAAKWGMETTLTSVHLTERYFNIVYPHWFQWSNLSNYFDKLCHIRHRKLVLGSTMCKITMTKYLHSKSFKYCTRSQNLTLNTSRKLNWASLKARILGLTLSKILKSNWSFVASFFRTTSLWNLFKKIIRLK